MHVILLKEIKEKVMFTNVESDKRVGVLTSHQEHKELKIPSTNVNSD